MKISDRKFEPKIREVRSPDSCLVLSKLEFRVSLGLPQYCQKDPTKAYIPHQRLCHKRLLIFI